VADAFFHVLADAGELVELNAALDCLRKDGQLIVEVRRNRRTLEDVFIELVGETRA